MSFNIERRWQATAKVELVARAVRASTFTKEGMILLISPRWANAVRKSSPLW